MSPKILAAMAAQQGLLTRAQALDVGCSPHEIAHLLKTRAWVAVRRGVYADAEVWNALEPFRAKPLFEARAALLAMRRAWVLSHDTAAYAHGLAMLRPAEAHVHITRPGHTNAWTKYGVKHHLARFTDAERTEIDGLPTLSMARTVADVGREHGFRAGLITADSALRAGVPRAEMHEAVGMMTCWPGVTQARAAIELADVGAETPVESLARELVLSLGFDDVETQFPVQVEGGRVYWADLRVGPHLIEAHGRTKYVSPDQGGVAQMAAADVLLDERKRERLITAESLGISNVYWDDFFSGLAATRVRVREEIEASMRRFGAKPAAHLLENARRIRAAGDRRAAV